ncbi:MAG: BON domain-containing protein [Burkholderiaceae bacterium]
MTKTDTQIQHDVLAELAWEPSVDAAAIGVEVKDGIVTLAGHVGSFNEKWEAEHAAQRVGGVKALAIEIDVKLPGSSARTDADIARSAENVIEWMTYLPKDAVKVMVEHGWITLTGQVDWAFQKEGAESGVRSLMGVTGVSDQIVLKAKVSMRAVKADIEIALQRRAHTEARDISVAIDGTDVTLAGTVHSWSERSLARRTAWSTPGVHRVIDHMTVVD